MKISYNLDVEDWVNFQEYYRKKKAPLYGCMIPLLTLLFVCNVITGIYMTFIYKGENQYSWVLLICIALLLFLLFMQMRTRKRLTKAGNKLKKESPDVFGHTEMEFFEEGFEIKTENGKKFLKWADLENYDQTKEYVFFFSIKGYAYIVPKKNINDLPRLELILNHLTKK